MDIATNDSGGVLPVHILRERVGKGENGGGVREVVKVDVYEKYEDLEKAVFALYSKRRDGYLLHFHHESHDRCEVKLKDSHWDKGTYFRSDLLSGGALRLIPHFVALLHRPEGAKKRGFETMETAFASHRPQKKWLQEVKTQVLPAVAEENEGLDMAGDLDRIGGPASDEIVASTEDAIPAGGYTAEEDQAGKHATEDHEELEREAFEATLTSKPAKDYLKFGPKNHGKWVVQPAQHLPPDVTYNTWRVEFAAAKQRYIDSHKSPYAQRSAGNVAHSEMIQGKYGMIALNPCGHCIKARVTCRIYHDDCLKWSMDAQHKEAHSRKFVFGWRCDKCRNRSNGASTGGCNAMHER